MQRKTKIIATLGPSTDSEHVMRRILQAGVNIVRVNFSHGDASQHRQRIRLARESARAEGITLGILGDLQGPKIRIEKFRSGSVTLKEGQRFTLDVDQDPDAGDEHGVAVSYPELPDDVRNGQVLMLSDGAIAMQVVAVEGRKVRCEVMIGGQLDSRQGLNLRGGGLSAAGLTEKDYDDIRFAAEEQLDFLAVSFPRSARDMQAARRFARQSGCNARLVAKVERAEAVEDLDNIIEASDVVMVARGDLGVEIGDAELPGVQKRIISAAREGNRMVITATQMMESMISEPIPTRAEVLDVANAVLDGTDAVMLSAETAVGAHPIKTVQAMSRICVGAERGTTAPRMITGMDRHFRKTDEAIAMATMYTASHMGADAIVSLTESGTTALLMSRQDTRVPIYAMTQYQRSCNYLAMCRGVYPVHFIPTELLGILPMREALQKLKELGLLKDGDRVLITKGDYRGPGGTNAMKIATVGEL